MGEGTAESGATEGGAQGEVMPKPIMQGRGRPRKMSRLTTLSDLGSRATRPRSGSGWLRFHKKSSKQCSRDQGGNQLPRACWWKLDSGGAQNPLIHFLLDWMISATGTDSRPALRPCAGSSRPRSIRSWHRRPRNTERRQSLRSTGSKTVGATYQNPTDRTRTLVRRGFVNRNRQY